MAALIRFNTLQAVVPALLALTTLLGTFSVEAGEAMKKPIRKLSYDPDADKKELFAAIEEGSIEYKMIMKDSKQGTLLLENKTDQPLSIGMPASVVGVQVFPQFGDMGGGTFGSGGMGGGQGGGAQQSIGGGAMGGGAMGGGGMMGGGMGGGFFSIPAEKAIAVPLTSVCLEYGKREPSSQSTYKLVKTEEFTEDGTLQELLILVASQQINPDVAQAAAWHVSSKLSWAELASKTNNHFGAAGPQRLFSNAHLYAAQNLVSLAQGKAREKMEEKPAEEVSQPVPSRVNRILQGN